MTDMEFIYHLQDINNNIPTSPKWSLVASCNITLHNTLYHISHYTLHCAKFDYGPTCENMLCFIAILRHISNLRDMAVTCEIFHKN